MDFPKRFGRLAVLPLAVALVVVSAAAASLEPPPAPTHLTATAMSFQRVDLAWNGSWMDEGYELERSMDGTTWISLGRGSAGRQAELWGLEGETTQYFRVRAFNTAGVSPYSNVASARTLTMPPGLLEAVAVSRSRIDLTWQDNSGEETRFELERSLDRETFRHVASVGANVTTYSDTPLRKSTTYHYSVRACTDTACTPFTYPATATTATR